jgi:hypothetical protein
MDCAKSHDLIAIDVIHLAVGEENRFKAETFGALSALDGFLNATRGAMQAKIHNLSFSLDPQ